MRFRLKNVGYAKLGRLYVILNEPGAIADKVRSPKEFLGMFECTCAQFICIGTEISILGQQSRVIYLENLKRIVDERYLCVVV